MSFVLLLAYAGWIGWQNAGAPGLVWHVWLILFFFVCVVLHELGHSLTARRYGVHVSRIQLLPIGGMAEMDRIPTKPSAEFWITAAGPAVNFAIAALLLPFVWAEVFQGKAFAERGLTELGVNLLVANMLMGVFNLLPIFPMDGGRILRAMLATRVPYLKATRWAVWVTRIAAPILSFVAFFHFEMPLLGILFIFIFLASDAEYRIVKRREEEAQHWAEVARRLALATGVDPDKPKDREPDVIIHGPN